MVEIDEPGAILNSWFINFSAVQKNKQENYYCEPENTLGLLCIVLVFRFDLELLGPILIVESVRSTTLLSAVCASRGPQQVGGRSIAVCRI